MISTNKYIKGIDLFESHKHLSSDQIKFLNMVCPNKYKYNLKNGFVDVNGDVNIRDTYHKDLTFIPWGEISGNFRLDNNYSMTSLKGSPIRIKGSLIIYRCFKLKNLEYCTANIEGTLNCSYNLLESIKGAPRKIGGSFNCSYNEITSLEGAPEEVGESFNVISNKLISLKGGPRKIGLNYDCSYNKLTSLKYLPDRIDFLKATSNELITLDCDNVEEIKIFDISSNKKLTSLEGGPKKIHTYIAINFGENLKTLKHLPVKDITSFYYSKGSEKPIILIDIHIKDVSHILSHLKDYPIFKTLITPKMVDKLFKDDPNEAVVKIKGIWNYLIEEYPEIKELKIPQKHKYILDILSNESDLGF